MNSSNGSLQRTMMDLTLIEYQALYFHSRPPALADFSHDSGHQAQRWKRPLQAPDPDFADLDNRAPPSELQCRPARAAVSEDPPAQAWLELQLMTCSCQNAKTMQDCLVVSPPAKLLKIGMHCQMRWQSERT